MRYFDRHLSRLDRGIRRPGQYGHPAALEPPLRLLANFKVPKHVFVVADLPRSASMKILKQALRDDAPARTAQPRTERTP